MTEPTTPDYVPIRLATPREQEVSHDWRKAIDDLEPEQRTRHAAIVRRIIAAGWNPESANYRAYDELTNQATS